MNTLIRLLLFTAIFSFIFAVLISIGLCQRYGKASWYSTKSAHNLMANGEPLDDFAYTAASWYYKLGTKVLVTNIKNGKEIEVTITDRGPNKRLGRIIDLSKSAYAKIADLSKGVIEVRIEKL